MIIATFDIMDWFWIVAGDTSRAWSSKAGAYVTKWPKDRQTHIVSEAELSEVLLARGISGPMVLPVQIQHERERRLARGFDYDFGDDRGVHRIGTTAADLAGWDEVSKVASAAIALGMPEQTVGIVTDTGPTHVKAIEWQAVLLAAATFRQPIWHGSFALQATSPIPADYKDDKYWN